MSIYIYIIHLYLDNFRLIEFIFGTAFVPIVFIYIYILMNIRYTFDAIIFRYTIYIHRSITVISICIYIYT